jgi:hypothetical protein
MEEAMAQALQMFRDAVPSDVLLRIVEAALQGRRAPTRERHDIHHQAGPLGAPAMRDVGPCREAQDYRSSVDVSTSEAQRLHRIADAARWVLPR